MPLPGSGGDASRTGRAKEPPRLRVLTALPIPISIFAAAALAFLLPSRLDPAVFVARALAMVAGAGVALVSAESLVSRLRDRAAAGRLHPEPVLAALACGMGGLGIAHAVLPPMSGTAGLVARGLVLAACALAAAHGGVTLAAGAGRTAAPQPGWRARPVQSAVLRATTVLFPIAASFSVAVALDRTLPPPPSSPALVARIVLVLFCSYVALFLSERLVRRLGPLAMLLKLSLAFPGGTPSRFAIARRSRNPHALREQLERARRGDDVERSRAAESILALATALTSHDSRTRGHSERVRVFTDMLADELRLTRADRDRLRWAALLHDIGKLTVSPRILNKAGPLDRTQWRVMERHPEEGSRIISPLAPWLGQWATAVEQHHERFDGTGYPNGVAGDGISLGGRIITVADAYDTMTAARPYKAAMTPAAARQEVERCAGTHFDPVVVRALLNISIRRLWWRMGVASWLAQLPLLGRVPQTVAPVGELAATGVRTAAAVAGVAAATALPGLGRSADRPAPAGNGIVSIQATAADHPAASGTGYGEREDRDRRGFTSSRDDERGGGSGRGGGRGAGGGAGGGASGSATGGLPPPPAPTGGEGSGSSVQPPPGGGGDQGGSATGGSDTGGSDQGGGSKPGVLPPGLGGNLPPGHGGPNPAGDPPGNSGNAPGNTKSPGGSS